MVIFPLAPDQTIAQMWSNGARGGVLVLVNYSRKWLCLGNKYFLTSTSTGTGTCEKVLVAKTKSFSAVIDTLWHLYFETLECLDYWFYVHRLALFGGFAFHKFFDFQISYLWDNLASYSRLLVQYAAEHYSSNNRSLQGWPVHQSWEV